MRLPTNNLVVSCSLKFLSDTKLQMISGSKFTETEYLLLHKGGICRFSLFSSTVAEGTFLPGEKTSRKL